MALSQEQEDFVGRLYDLYINEKKLAEVTSSRMLREAELVNRYNINQANSERAQIVNDAQMEAAPLYAENKSLKENLVKLP